MKLKVINLQFPSCLSRWKWLLALIRENEGRICQLYLGKAPSLTRWCTLLVSITSSHGLTDKSMSMSSWIMSRFAKSFWLFWLFWKFNPQLQDGKGNNFRIQAGPRYDHYDFNSVMHYGEYAFRNKEWGGIASQATRTLYPNPLSVSSVMVRSL